MAHEDLADALADRYLLEEELGRGASATVYLAQDLRHGRRVALKVLHSALGQALGVERFQREIRTQARLHHPHILPLFDSGEVAVGDAPRATFLYYVMPYIETGSLADRLERRPALAVPAAVRLAREVASALSYAHALGVIHRDLKPANILMGADGEAKVADFGVAFSNLTFDSTRAMVVGSPAYMAPEQIEGKPASMKSDMYSMGIMLYKMLVGALPFAPDSPAALATRIMLGNLPAPSEARPDVPAMLDVIFSRATHRDPEMRYPSWEDFAADLRAIAHPDGEVDAQERVAQLRKLPFFRDFGDAALAEVVPMARWFDVRAGSQLVGEGDPGYSFFVLARGQMRVTRGGTLLAIRGAGECLAETAFLRSTGARRFSSIAAVTDCTVIEINPDVLWLASAETTRKFHLAFLHAMAHRLENAEGALAEMMASKNVTLF